MQKIKLCGMTCQEISGLIQSAGYHTAHALKVSMSLYRKRIDDFSHISGIPKTLKAYLNDIAEAGFYNPHASDLSADGTIKYLFISPEGKQFESVYIPDVKRRTVCVSIQSGCRMGCSFCVTGKYGFHGNLTAGDILNQILSIPLAEKITHVVFMGMGEPMDNLDNVLKACRIITAEWGMAISPKKITVSSVGITHAIEEFLEKSDCNLTISLYSPFADERVRIIPAERTYPVREIIRIMKEYPLEKKRRFSVGYIMIDRVNDTDRHLHELIKMLSGTNIRVNLLPYHSVRDDINRSTPDEKMLFFKHELIISGISASVRKSRGSDISAACGLLASGLH